MNAGVIRAFTVLAIPATLLACSSGRTIAADGAPGDLDGSVRDRIDTTDVDLDRTPAERTADALLVDSGSKLDDGGDAADPFRCDTVKPLVLSNPIVSSGTVAAGQMVTLQLTLTDSDPNGYVSYPGAVITSSTAGVTFASNISGPPGSDIDGITSKPITFYVTFDSSIPRGTEVDFTARAYGWGHQAPDCQGFVLSFSLTTN